MKEFKTSGMEILNTILVMKEYLKRDFTYDRVTFKYFLDTLGIQKILEICDDHKEKYIQKAIQELNGDISLLKNEQERLYHVLKPVIIHLYSWLRYNCPTENIPDNISNLFPTQDEVTRGLKDRQERTLERTMKDISCVTFMKNNPNKFQMCERMCKLTEDEMLKAYDNKDIPMDCIEIRMEDHVFTKWKAELKELRDIIKKQAADWQIKEKDRENTKRKFRTKVRNRFVEIIDIVKEDTIKIPTDALEVMQFQIKNVNDLCDVFCLKNYTLDMNLFQQISDLYEYDLDEFIEQMNIVLLKRKRLYDAQIKKEGKKILPI